LEQGDSPAAERTARQWISVDSCYASWTKLAEVKKLTGDTDGWLEASQEALKHPVLGLEHAEVQSAIARHFLDVNEAERALPFADDAAKTGAAWAMLLAAEVHERRGDMEEAEQYQRYTAQRYEDNAPIWFMWCLRTGEGDLESAREYAERHLRGDRICRINQYAAMAEASKDWDAAFTRMVGVARNSQDPFYAWFAAALADSQDAATERSEMLQRVIALDDSGDEGALRGTAEIASYIEAQLTDANGASLDVDRLDRLVACLHAGGMTNMYF
jgi:hypothetical protein